LRFPLRISLNFSLLSCITPHERLKVFEFLSFSFEFLWNSFASFLGMSGELLDECLADRVEGWKATFKRVEDRWRRWKWKTNFFKILPPPMEILVFHFHPSTSTSTLPPPFPSSLIYPIYILPNSLKKYRNRYIEIYMINYRKIMESNYRRFGTNAGEIQQ